RGRPLAPASLHQLVAQVADREVAHGGVQVALEVAHAEARPLLPQPGKDVVYQLLRYFARAHVAVSELAQAGMVGAERALEGCGVAGADPRSPSSLLAGERWSLRADVRRHGTRHVLYG